MPLGPARCWFMAKAELLIAVNECSHAVRRKKDQDASKRAPKRMFDALETHWVRDLTTIPLLTGMLLFMKL